jgi:ribosomal protein S18 acetylase RimI-like enzyme
LPNEVIQKVTSVWHAPERLEEQANDEKIIFKVAVDNYEEIVGLITISKNDGDTADLLRLYVRPDRQRHGIGKILLEHAITELRKYKKLRLQVEEENEKGKSFYHKTGFMEIEKNIENVEGEKLKTIIMERFI